MQELLNTAQKLNKVYQQFELLQFRTHKAIPLTFNKKDSQQLLSQNKRLYFSYRYLTKEKTRLTNLLLNQTIDVKDQTFQENVLLHPQMIEKALKLKNIDDDHRNKKSNSPRRNRKINKLKQLNALIDDENLTLCRGYLTQLIMLIYNHQPALFPDRTKPYQSKELLHDLNFRTDLLQFDYDRYLYQDFEVGTYLEYLIYKTVGRKATYVRYFDARELIPSAADCGFSGIAYEIMIDGISECYITFKGTEADMDYTVRSRSKRFEKYILEGYKDWDYNVNAILIGKNIDLDQMETAQKFLSYVKNQLPVETKMFGLGHSLGGHFVQSLQLVSNCFDAGYTMNSAPVQLKQVQALKPDLMSDENWQKIFSITKDKIITPELNEQIKKLLPRDYSEIVNQAFYRDLTQIFYELPYTIWVGQKWDYDFPNWKYPFKIHPHQYLNLDEINSYQNFFGGLFAYTKNSKSGRQIMKRSFDFARDRFKILRRDINEPDTYQFFIDYATYLYESGIFKDKPKEITAYLSSNEENSVWRNSRTEWPFLRSLNRDMLDLSIYFHIIYGSKHFMNKEPVKKFK